MSAVEAEVPEKEELYNDVLGCTVLEDEVKEKKKKKHRGEKRKRSCSTESVSSDTSSQKRHKKKKKKRSRDEAPSAKVNPIFVWVKQDDTRIVEVMCEDYDKRNRIKLTKTKDGWVSIPRTHMFCPEAPEDKEIEVNMTADEPEPSEPKEIKVEAKQEVKEEVKKEVQEVKAEVREELEEEERKEPECREVKCCPEANVDENHNNEVEGGAGGCVDFCKDLGEDVKEVRPVEEPIPVEDSEVPIVTISDDDTCPGMRSPENCVNLMNELADLCFPGKMKEEQEPKDLNDIYTFVPSPVSVPVEPVKVPEVSVQLEMCVEEKSEVHEPTPAPEPVEHPTTPVNLVVLEDDVEDEKKEGEVKAREEEDDDDDDGKMEELKQSDLDSLDILWRLPEGTTICTSRPHGLDVKPPTTPLEKPLSNFSQPVQEEPLNLGKPKPVEEKKVEKVEKVEKDSKLLELLKPEEKVQNNSNPLEQLKEVLADPDLTVPDPLLVPRARLGALIANPAKEIPKLLAQKREIKYPKLDPDLMVVSLAHLQSLLQKSGEADKMSLFHRQMMSGCEPLESATAALNQMLWLPYLQQLDAAHNQELMAMLYPTYMHTSYFTPPTQPNHAARYPYPRPPWPRAESSKSLQSQFHKSKPQAKQPQKSKPPLLPLKLTPPPGMLKLHGSLPKQQSGPKLHSPTPAKQQQQQQQTPTSTPRQSSCAKLGSPPLPGPMSRLSSPPAPAHQQLRSPQHSLQSPPAQSPCSSALGDQQQPQQPQQPQRPKLKVRDNLIDPKLKLRESLAEPRTDLLKLDPTLPNPFLPGPPLPGLPPNSNLWHPLFSSSGGNELLAPEVVLHSAPSGLTSSDRPFSYSTALEARRATKHRFPALIFILGLRTYAFLTAASPPPTPNFAGISSRPSTSRSAPLALSPAPLSPSGARPHSSCPGTGFLSDFGAASPDGKYTSRWNWTTPVTVSGE